MNYDKEKHLEFISSVIERMAQNSFTLKEFAVTFFTGSVVSQFFTLTQLTQKKEVLILWWFLMLIFWFLDSWFLKREKEFRCLFDKVRLSTTDMKYVMKPIWCDSFCSVFLSIPNAVLYLVLILTLVILFFYC